MAGSDSTKQQWAAPRDKASMPNTPVPANKSRQRAPGSRGASQLNKVSRTRSPVGRRPGASGTGICRRRQSPPMIRTCCGRVGRRLAGLRAANGQLVNLDGGLADTHGQRLAVLAADTNAIVQREIVPNHRDACQRIRSIAD